MPRDGAYEWVDRDEDVRGELASHGRNFPHPWIVATLSLTSTPNSNFPKDRGSLGILIDRKEAQEIIDWLKDALTQHAAAQC